MLRMVNAGQLGMVLYLDSACRLIVSQFFEHPVEDLRFRTRSGSARRITALRHDIQLSNPRAVLIGSSWGKNPNNLSSLTSSGGATVFGYMQAIVGESGAGSLSQSTYFTWNDVDVWGQTNLGCDGDGLDACEIWYFENLNGPYGGGTFETFGGAEWIHSTSNGVWDYDWVDEFMAPHEGFYRFTSNSIGSAYGDVYCGYDAQFENMPTGTTLYEYCYVS